MRSESFSIEEKLELIEVRQNQGGLTYAICDLCIYLWCVG